MNKYLIPIHEVEIIEDEMLGFITGGSVASINACGNNRCGNNSGNCTDINECKQNSGSCGVNNCGIHSDAGQVGPPVPGNPKPDTPCERNGN